MPLNVPVTITLPPIDRQFTVHTDRQRWCAEQLAASPDGRAALEAAVREGVRKAAPACAYAQLTAPDIETAAHTDGSVTMTGRVLCDESDCHAAAQRHHVDAAESIEAKAAADWVAQRELGPAPGELGVVRKRVLSSADRRQRRASFGFVLVGVLCVAAGGAMGQYDYTKPAGTSPGTSIGVWIGTNADSLCNTLALPAILAGALLVLFGPGRLVTDTTK
ncbi:hypothetical protein [Streptomyces silvensis]|uniref:Uncharacterized protein n=1 Tax=Streptomyces silvensis TaxID=1765722 RepID=A0A0W7X388_9ACTN|nr:hypothetical protein [Streptomyces silvensis]KUF17357.1 hypothetical protein AT728_16260 [Streptomyces silvensis]